MIFSRMVVASATLGLLVACSEETADTSDAPDTAQINIQSSDGQKTADIQKLHVLEQYCVEYEHTGAMQSGTSKECIRKWGLEQTQWDNTKISMGAFSQESNQRVITKGKTVISFDPATLQGTKMDNPFYDSIAEAAQKEGAQDFAQSMIQAMGFQPTDQTKEIAGETCNVYSGQMGAMCMTEDGLTLETNIAGMTKKATKIDRSTGGSDADYVIPDGLTFTEVPNLGDLMQGNMPQQ